MKQCKYIFIIPLITLFATMICSCENKRDDNGALGGMWQLTEWRQGNSVVAGKDSRIFYCVYWDLIKFESTRSDLNDYYLSTFQHTKDSLILTKIVYYKNDSVVRPQDLQGKFGIPESGRYHIDVLNEKHLVLSTSTDTLAFRKY